MRKKVKKKVFATLTHINYSIKYFFFDDYKIHK